MRSYIQTLGPFLAIILVSLVRQVADARRRDTPALTPAAASPEVRRPVTAHFRTNALRELRDQYLAERAGARAAGEVRALLAFKSWQEIAHERPHDRYAKEQAEAEHRRIMRSLWLLARACEIERPGNYAGPWVGVPDADAETPAATAARSP
ncbi:MAG TPA: hypothetical protein VIE42_13825 [Steroidobacteraceae bacterium]|jgi:hypothetical protein